MKIYPDIYSGYPQNISNKKKKKKKGKLYVIKMTTICSSKNTIKKVKKTIHRMGENIWT